MQFEEKDISNKNPLVALILCLFFGRFGIHRFYVGRYLSGFFYFLIGSTSIVLYVLGLGYAFLSSVLYLFLIAFDTYALYSDSFTDSKGRLVTDNQAFVYKDNRERNRILYEKRENKIICILLAFIFYVVYFLLSHYLF